MYEKLYLCCGKRQTQFYLVYRIYVKLWPIFHPFSVCIVSRWKKGKNLIIKPQNSISFDKQFFYSLENCLDDGWFGPIAEKSLLTQERGENRYLQRGLVDLKIRIFCSNLCSTSHQHFIPSHSISIKHISTQKKSN